MSKIKTSKQQNSEQVLKTHPLSLQRGAKVISTVVPKLPSSPGIYSMKDEGGHSLYIGKAKNLKLRVSAYSRPENLPVRIQRMVAATNTVEVIRTHTEIDALLLENNLIKKLKPRYNILLRDDKSFPYILLTKSTNWPQLVKHRGQRSKNGEYFGPFASAGAVNRTLAILQKAFPLRNCSDQIFSNRTRPCLQYQIKRCTAPCVGKIKLLEYNTIVDEAKNFLKGDSRRVQNEMSERMQKASDTLNFEEAAVYRDRIHALTQIQAHQDINVRNLGDADIIVVEKTGNIICLQVFFFRAGQNFGNWTYFPSRITDDSLGDVMGSFLGQFYTDKTPPPTILCNEVPHDRKLINDALSFQAKRKVLLSKPIRGPKRKLVDHAITNTKETLARRLSESATQRRLLEGLAKTLEIEGPLLRIEVYDNSHISGSNPVGAMIVAGAEGFNKSAYRKFNIKDKKITPGDDYSMMRQVMKRRFQRALKDDPGRETKNWPNLLLVDGGLGQLNAVTRVLEGMALTDIPIAAISKGAERNSGREKIHVNGKLPLILQPNDPILYFLQRLRDEAHRFAIGTHRLRRKKSTLRSPLDDIAGIGSKRKRSLLLHFGSARGVASAGLKDLEAVTGINQPLAKKIYEHFH